MLQALYVLGTLLMTPDELLVDWRRRARESQFGHFEASKHFGLQHYWTGIPVVVVSAIVGTSIFATLQSQEALAIQIVLGMLSVSAAVLASLQTFLGSSEKAEKHRAAGAAYGAIRREIEQTISLGLPEEAEGKKVLDAFRERFDELALQAPEISPKIWKRTDDILAKYDNPPNV